MVDCAGAIGGLVRERRLLRLLLSSVLGHLETQKQRGLQPGPGCRGDDPGCYPARRKCWAIGQASGDVVGEMRDSYLNQTWPSLGL